MSDRTKSTEDRAAILIVEDSPTQAEELSYLLGRQGYQVRVAENGRQALALVGEQKPTLIISDIIMPDMNGYELCRHLKADDSNRDIPVVLLTALSDPTDVLQGLECGADSFITKPYSEDYLLAHIQQILGNWKLRKSDRVRVGVEILFAGKRRFISADQQQMLSLLLSTYEAAVQRNHELVQTQEELSALNERLEDKVMERTAALTAEMAERKQAEEALQATERQLSLIYANVSDVLLYLAVEPGDRFRFVSVNSAFLKATGLTEDQIVGKLVQEVIPEPAHALVLGNFKEAIRTKRAVGWEEVSVYPAGKKYGEVSVTPILDASGNCTHLIETVHDITERKQAEEALRESEDKFKYVFDHSVIGKSITLPSGEINVNSAFCETLGYGQEELNSRKWQEITHPEDIALTQTMIDQLLSGQMASARFTKRYLHKNGSIVWTEVGTALRRDQAGQPLYFLTTMNDITERKRSEAALDRERRLLRTVIDALPDQIFAHDRDGRFIFNNRSDAQILGVSDPETLLGKNHEDFLPPELATRFQAEDQQIIESGQPLINWEESSIAPDGNRRWTLTTKVLWRDSLGQVIGLVGITRDITERKQAEQALKEYSSRLEADVAQRTQELRDAQEQLIRQERLAVLGQLASSVAHELRNPLGVIANAVYFLKAVQPNADAAILDYLGVISAEVNNADKIVTDLLDFARIKGVARETVDLAALLERALQKHPPAATITVVSQYSDPLPPLFVDPRQIEQVLTNLVINACQAMPEGGALTLRAEVVSESLSASPEPPFVALHVVDTGTGISPENMKKLFEPLFTTKAKGIGLGLAVSKKLIEANGGKIEVQSQPGQGSTFTIFLPTEDRSKD